MSYNETDSDDEDYTFEKYREEYGEEIILQCILLKQQKLEINMKYVNEKCNENITLEVNNDDKEHINKTINIDEIKNNYTNDNEKYNEIFNALDDTSNVFKFLNYEFRNNRKICMYALEKDRMLYRYIGDDMKNSTRLADYCLSNENGHMYKYFNYKLRSHGLIAKKAFDETEEWIMPFVPYSLRNNSQFMLSIMKPFGINLLYASDRLCNNLYFAINAINIEFDNVKYISDELKNNRFIANIFTHAGLFWRHKLIYMSKKLQDEYITTNEISLYDYDDIKNKMDTLGNHRELIEKINNKNKNKNNKNKTDEHKTKSISEI